MDESLERLHQQMPEWDPQIVVFLPALRAEIVIVFERPTAIRAIERFPMGFCHDKWIIQ